MSLEIKGLNKKFDNLSLFSDFSIEFQGLRFKTALGKAALQRHLTAFETNLVVAARTGFLPFVATTSRLTQTRANAPAYATLCVFCTIRRLDVIEFHHSPLRGF